MRGKLHRSQLIMLQNYSLGKESGKVTVINSVFTRKNDVFNVFTGSQLKYVDHEKWST